MNKIIDIIEDWITNHLVQSPITNIRELANNLDEIPDIKKSSERILKAIKNKETIYWVHDSDADGQTSAVVSKKICDDFNHDNRVHRITKRADGYGFLPKHVDEALESSASLIITTDNGITSHEACIYAKQKGIDVIITDHHMPEKNGLPDAYAIVDPQLINNDSMFKDMCGAVVIFLIGIYINKILGFEQYKWQENLEEIGLSTIADMMPIQHINRLFVKESLDLFNNPRKPYVQIFRNNLKYENFVKAETIAFSLSPVLNAAKRFDVPDKGYELLTTDDFGYADQLWTYLTHINELRKSTTQDYMDLVKDARVVYGKFAYVNLANVNTGILGVLANKLVEKYKIPAIVTATNGNVVSGSGRSLGKINMLKILQRLDYVQVGGHEQAFGVTFPKDKIKDFIIDNMKILSQFPDSDFTEPDQSIIDILFSDVTKELYDTIQKYEPYGKDFPRPVLGANATVKKAFLFGKQKNHMKFILEDIQNNTIETVKFFETGNFKPGDKVRINFTIEWDNWINDVTIRLKSINKI